MLVEFVALPGRGYDVFVPLVLNPLPQVEFALIAAGHRTPFPISILYFMAFAGIQNRNNLHDFLLSLSSDDEVYTRLEARKT
jgi:hypothetical protein